MAAQRGSTVVPSFPANPPQLTLIPVPVSEILAELLTSTPVTRGSPAKGLFEV